MSQHITTKKIKRRSSENLQVELSPEIHPVLNKIYLSRDIKYFSELDNSFSQLLSPDRLMGMKGAVEIIFSAIKNDEKILIVADYDADGATSCAVVIRALRKFGAKKLSYIVPDRFKYGYGLTPAIVKLAANQSPDLIITVDNGIASIEGVQAARDAGIKVLVTDHHLPGKTNPSANAIVNPNQHGCDFPSKSLAGVGVIFYIMIALRTRLRKEDWFKKNNLPEYNLSELTDIVALGTVADLVKLDHNNRILVAQGLVRINKGKSHAGINALLNISDRKAGQINSSDLGFYVGPRINAAGRLENMALGIECLLTDNHEEAATIASKLDKINRERRAIQKKMQEQALQIVQALHIKENSIPVGFCLFDKSWHQGVIGLVASKVKELYHRPVIAFAPGDNGDIKGSARSIPGLHIRDALDEVATTHPAMLQKFGGHAMAAGLSIKSEHLEEFSSAFETIVTKMLAAENLEEVVLTDGELSGACFTNEFAELTSMAAPWGQGFEAPVFDNDFEVISSKIVGENHLKLKLKLATTDGEGKNLKQEIDAIAFNQSFYVENTLPEKIHAAYKLDINEYRGWRNLQLIIEHIEN